MGAAGWSITKPNQGGGQGDGLIGIANHGRKGQRDERQKEPSHRAHSMHAWLPLRAGGGQKQGDTGCGGGYWAVELGQSWCLELLWAKHSLGSLCRCRGTSTPPKP